MIGTTVTHYKVLERIGGGGMGVVYKARDTKLGRTVALKFLPDHLAENPRALERFRREAKTASSLNHPHICTIYDVDEHEGRPFIAMELLVGQTLRERIQGSPLPSLEALDLGIQIADALEAAHSRGIIHRDIKPANLFVTTRNQIKVLDFGLAKAVPKGGLPDSDALMSEDVATVTHDMLTDSGAAVGTVAFMSPEQARGETLDARTDVFSFGEVLYQMVTGEPPFTGNTAAVVFHALLEKQPTPPGQVNHEVPTQLDRLITGALEKDREVRVQSAAQLRAELTKLHRTLTGGSGADIAGAGESGERSRMAGVLLATLALAALVVLFVMFGPGNAPAGFPDNARFEQLTSQSGEELFPNLSPDARSFIYISYATGGGDIYLQRVDGANPNNLTVGSEAYDGEASFSNDGNFIAFRSDRQAGGIFVMGATGESVRQLADFGYNPAWSPDDSQILFTSEQVLNSPERRFGVSELWAVDVATEQTRRIHGGDAVQSGWAPDGERIVYWAQEAGRRDIWTISADGSDSIRVTDDDALDWNPVWSPEGFIYFSSDRGGNMNLWRVPVSASGVLEGDPQPVTTGVVEVSQHPTISADGKRLAYAARTSSRNIQRIGFDPASKQTTGFPEAVTEGSILSEWSDPSPDGQAVAFMRQDDIFVTRTDGSGLNRLTDDDFNDRHPKWSPDGDKILFYSNRGGSLYQIWVMNPDGSGKVQVTDDDSEPVYPAWSPDGERISYGDTASGSFIIEANAAGGQERFALPPLEAVGTAFMARSWSPDGRFLAGDLLVLDDQRLDGILVYSFESGEYDQVAEHGVEPTWLGDSQTILFQSNIVPPSEILQADRISKEVRPILSNSPYSLAGPSLPLDDRTLFYTAIEAEADIWLITIP